MMAVEDVSDEGTFPGGERYPFEYFLASLRTNKATLMRKRRLTQNNILKPNMLSALLVLASILFSFGCDTKKGLKVGDTAPAFSSTDTTGESVSLSQFKGKMVILYFWADSCCGERLKFIEPFYSKNKQKGLALLAIDVGDPKEVVAAYARNNRLTFTMLTDVDGKIFRQYQLRGFPTIMILDKNGIIRQVVLGEVQPAQLEKLVQRQFDVQKEVEAAYEKVHPR